MERLLLIVCYAIFAYVMADGLCSIQVRILNNFFFRLAALSFDAEIHAALAATSYVDKHAPLLAENQFTFATLLDPHYMDISFVEYEKQWPPSLISSFELFITLS